MYPTIVDPGVRGRQRGSRFACLGFGTVLAGLYLASFPFPLPSPFTFTFTITEILLFGGLARGFGGREGTVM